MFQQHNHTNKHNSIKTLQTTKFFSEPEPDVEKFIKGNKENIVKYARKFVPFSPYDLEDFIQEAFVVALETKEKVENKPFSVVFWEELSRAYSRMAKRKPSAPLDEDEDEEKITGSVSIEQINQQKEIKKENLQLLICFLIALKKIHRAINKTSEKQKEVCLAALANYGRCKTQEEFARLFSETTNRKISRQAVMALIDRSSKNIKEASYGIQKNYRFETAPQEQRIL